MGVKDFFKLFTGRVVNLNTLRGQTIAIDAMTEIYRATLGIREPLRTTSGKVTTHISVLITIISKYRKAGINQIYVFDGEVPPALKGRELARRRELRRKVLITDNVTTEVIEDVKKIIRLMGIPYMVAPDGFDAEHICAELNSTNVVDHVLSTDADVFLYGGKSLLKYEKRQLMQYTRADFIAQTGIPDANIVDAAVLLGTDFNAKTKGIGPKSLAARWESVTKTPEQTFAVALFRTKPTLPQVIRHDAQIPALLDWLVTMDFSRVRTQQLLG